MTHRPVPSEDSRQPPRSSVHLVIAVIAVMIPLLALIGLPTWRQGVLEAVIISVMVGTVFTRPALRATFGQAPRALLAISGVALGIWTWSQLHEVELATYPFMSWHMYGEPLERSGVVGYQLAGEQCNGEIRIIPSTGGPMGRRPVLAFGVRRAYAAARSSTGDRAQALVRTDSLLGIILDRWNRQTDLPRLCAVRLQQITVPVHALAVVPLPPYATVRRYVAP